MDKLAIPCYKQPAINKSQFIFPAICFQPIMDMGVYNASVQGTSYRRHIFRPVRHTCQIDILVKFRIKAAFPCHFYIRFRVVTYVDIFFFMAVGFFYFFKKLPIPFGHPQFTGYKAAVNSLVATFYKKLLNHFAGKVHIGHTDNFFIQFSPFQIFMQAAEGFQHIGITEAKRHFRFYFCTHSLFYRNSRTDFHLFIDFFQCYFIAATLHFCFLPGAPFYFPADAFKVQVAKLFPDPEKQICRAGKRPEY